MCHMRNNDWFGLNLCGYYDPYDYGTFASPFLSIADFLANRVTIISLIGPADDQMGAPPVTHELIKVCQQLGQK